MKTKQPVPFQWYKEYQKELAHTIVDTKLKPLMQQKRVDDVLASGLGYEIMKGGNGHEWQIPLVKLQGFLAEARENATPSNIEKLRKELANFENKYTPIIGLKGYLQAAKNEAKLKKIANPNFFDDVYPNDYLYLIELTNKHFLSNKESDLLMDYFYKINIYQN